MNVELPSVGRVYRCQNSEEGHSPLPPPALRDRSGAGIIGYDVEYK